MTDKSSPNTETLDVHMVYHSIFCEYYSHYRPTYWCFLVVGRKADISVLSSCYSECIPKNASLSGQTPWSDALVS